MSGSSSTPRIRYNAPTSSSIIRIGAGSPVPSSKSVSPRRSSINKLTNSAKREDDFAQSQRRHPAVALQRSHTSPGKRSLKQYDQFPSPPRRVSLAVEQKEKILSLTELNNSLTRDLMGLQSDKSKLAERVNNLETEVRETGDKIVSLEREKRALEGKIRESRAEVLEREKKLEAVSQEKRLMECEKLSLVDAKTSLETQLIESEKKAKESCRRAEDAEAVVAVAVEEIDCLGQRLGQSLMCEISKKIELNGLQSCKSSLRKELKRFSSVVMKAKEEAGEAKEMIQNLRFEEIRLKEEKARVEQSLEQAIERAGALEKQEKSLSGQIQLLECKVVELERELGVVKEERERAVEEARAAGALCSPEQGMEGVRRSIQVLRDNSHARMQKVAQLQQQLSEGSSEIDLEEEKAGLERQMKQIMACSMDAMVKAEEQLRQLKNEVEGLNAAFKMARDANEQSQMQVWEVVKSLAASTTATSTTYPAEEPQGSAQRPPWLPQIPAKATYILAAGLFAYAMYTSTSSSSD